MGSECSWPKEKRMLVKMVKSWRNYGLENADSNCRQNELPFLQNVLRKIKHTHTNYGNNMFHLQERSCQRPMLLFIGDISDIRSHLTFTLREVGKGSEQNDT